VIAKVVHGWRPGGLIAYLLGPGVAEVHRSPRVIASWDGLDAGWQPERIGPSEYDLRLGPLIDALHAPAVAAGLPTRAPAETGRGYVWHCSVRLAAGDRVLGDQEWAGIARELLDGAGIAAAGDVGGPRWVAVRHADDHIHIAAVLVRQDTLRRFWPHHDYPKLRAAVSRIEQRLDLTVTAAADRTAARRPGRGEVEKAARQSRIPARQLLRREVQRAAIDAGSLAEFVAALEGAGVRVVVRRAPSGDPLGYAVAHPEERTAAGDPVFYSGSKLAPDLSLPRLLRRWDSDGPTAAGRGLPVSQGARIVGRARDRVARGSGQGLWDDPEGVDGIVHATGDVLAAMGATDGGPWRSAAERFDRAARTPHGTATVVDSAGGDLRRLARRLLRVRGVRARDAAGSAALAVALVGLIREIAAWQDVRGRRQQASAAREAANLLAPAAAASTGVPTTAAVRTPRVGNARERGPALGSRS
jgi:hypothetical protein